MDVMKIIHAALFTPAKEREGKTFWGLPICFWGPPGVGKTDRIQAASDRVNLPLEVLSPGERGEGAFGVTPVPTGGGGKNSVITYPPPDWVVELADGGFLFLDEVNQAPPPLQPALMGILLARRIGGAPLDPRVRCMAAANPTEQAAGGWDFAPPVANRMGHINWPDADGESWGSWLLGLGGDVEERRDARKEEERILKAWPTPWASARGIFAGFAKSRPELLHKMPQAGNPDLGKAWPSPRTWEMTCRAFTAAKIHDLPSADREEFMAAFVGSGPASELMEYIDKMDLPSPEDVLEKRVKFKFEPKRLDRSAAILNACAALVAPANATRRKERAENLWEILGDKDLMENGMDVAFSPAKSLCKSKLHMVKTAHPVLEKMSPVLTAAGIRYDASREDD